MRLFLLCHMSFEGGSSRVTEFINLAMPVFWVIFSHSFFHDGHRITVTDLNIRFFYYKIQKPDKDQDLFHQSV